MEYLLSGNVTENTEGVFDIAHTYFSNIPKLHSILDVDIVDIEEFTLRMKNALHQIGIKKVSQLLELSKIDLIITPGIGQKSRGLISSFIERNQLKTNGTVNRSFGDHCHDQRLFVFKNAKKIW